MTPSSTPFARHAALGALLTQAQAAYHDRASPIMTDAEYNALLTEQRALEAQHPELPRRAAAQIGTPEVGDVRHATLMQSLNSAFDQAGVQAFGTRLARKLGQDAAHVGFTVEYKLDGLSANIEYRDGLLVRATIRGDGESGEDITAQVRHIGVPETISAAGLVEVRGKIYMPLSAFEAHNAAATARGEAGFKYSRNATIDSLRKGTASRLALLKLAVYGAGSLGGLPERGMETQYGFLDWARCQGFHMPLDTRVVMMLDEAWAVHQQLEARRGHQDFEADGTVIKANRFDDQREAGRGSRAPAWVVAVKFANRLITPRSKTSSLPLPA